MLANHGSYDRISNTVINSKGVYEVVASYDDGSVALLPMQMPANMNTVEKQAEDVPYDVQCYKDAAGHVYDFGFGMNWKGVIKDGRVLKFKK